MISKTRKRLSDNRWYLPIIVLSIIGLNEILSYGVRSVSLSREYGIISSSIPTTVEIEDQESSNNRFKIYTISKKTPVIVLGNSAFTVGDVESVTSKYLGLRNKFKVPHVEGSPQMRELTKSLSAWRSQRYKKHEISPSEVGILLPNDQWPVAVVIQVMHYLKANDDFKHVILASELF